MPIGILSKIFKLNALTINDEELTSFDTPFQNFLSSKIYENVNIFSNTRYFNEY